MFPHLKGFNLKKWIDENRGDWGQRRVIWQDSDFIAFVTRGPNRRKDFHINPGDEIFYQLEGDLNLHYIKDNKRELATLQAGDIFLLPEEHAAFAAARGRLMDLCGGTAARQRGNRQVYLALRKMR